MSLATPGLHHVTAIARDPRRNMAFYVDVLGLRLIKRTINFDDRSTFHLYYGDRSGQPGSIVTFFVRPDAEQGRQGCGQAVTVRFNVAAGSLADWAAQLTRHGVRFDASEHESEATISVSDPDGLRIHLVAVRIGVEDTRPSSAGAPGDCVIRGLHSVVLSTSNEQPTAAVLTELGFAQTASGADGYRFAAAERGLGSFVDVSAAGALSSGTIGAGTVHHVAFRARDLPELLAWQHRLRADGIDVTEVKDRTYFRSIYFHEPGGTKFELATDGPGFAVDEAIEALGTRLQLPPDLETQRERLEAALQNHS